MQFFFAVEARSHRVPFKTRCPQLDPGSLCRCAEIAHFRPALEEEVRTAIQLGLDVAEQPEELGAEFSSKGHFAST